MKFTKFGIKLFYFFLIVSLVPLGIAGIVIYKYIHAKTKDEVLRQLQFNSHTINEKLHLLLSKRISRLIDFSSDGFIRDSVEQMSFLTSENSEIGEKLSNHLIINKKSLDPDILEIEIINYEGKVIASTSQEQIGKDRSKVKYFTEPYLRHEQKSPYFANTVNTSEYVDELQLVFSTVLKDKIFHKPLGVIVTKVKGGILQDMLRKTSFRYKGEIYILDSNQFLIASSFDHTALDYKQMNSHEVQEALTSRGEVTGRCKDYKGNPVLCTALYVPETNWVILSEKSIEDAFGQLVWIKYIFSISGGGALFLVFIFAFIGSNNINTIIRKLIDGTRRISKGDLEYPIEISKRNDELRELGNSFNLMMNKLNESNINIIKFINELKYKEISLRKSEEQLQAIMDNTTAVIYLKDIHGRYILLNRQFETLFHITREDIMGKTDMDIFPKEMAEAFQTNDLKVLNACVPIEMEEIAPHDDGPHTYISIKFPLFGSDGAPDRICGISTDITARKRAEERIVSYQRQLKSLASSLSLAEEKERRHIAENLHDRIGQSLIVLKMKLEALQESNPSINHNSIMDGSLDILEKTIQDIRTMTFELSPPVLYELGLVPAVEWLVEEFQKQHAIKIDFVGDSKVNLLSDDMRTILFKSVRELLFNIVKHAKAKNVMVSISRKNNDIQVNIKDDGVGFNPHDISLSTTNNGGFGLFSIRERLEHLGGRMLIKSKPGCGTHLILVAPLKIEKEETIAGR